MGASHNKRQVQLYGQGKGMTTVNIRRSTRVARTQEASKKGEQ